MDGSALLSHHELVSIGREPPFEQFLALIRRGLAGCDVDVIEDTDRPLGDAVLVHQLPDGRRLVVSPGQHSGDLEELSQRFESLLENFSSVFEHRAPSRDTRPREEILETLREELRSLADQVGGQGVIQPALNKRV